MNRLYTKGKFPVQLQDRDFEILRFIQSAGSTISGEINRRFWPDKSKIAGAGYQRLRKLVAAGLIYRRHRMLHLTEEAKELLAKAEMQAVERAG